MTQLETLIQTLCPNGVKFVKLGEVVKSIHSGLNPRDNFRLNEEGATGYYVTVKEITSGKIEFTDKTDRITEDAWTIIQNRSHLEVDDVLLSGIGTIGKVALVDIPVNNWNCSESVLLLKPNQEYLIPKFLVYILQSKEIQTVFNRDSVGSTLKGIRKKSLESLQIPLPPLAVQSEIVRVLDKFTLYKSELAAELAARLQQYEYYRDKLLTFDDKVKRVKLGEVGEFYGGLTGKTKEDFKDGNAKFITYKNIFSNLALDIDIEDRVFVAEGEKQNIVQYGDVLFTGSSETPDECGMSSVLITPTDEKLYLNSFCFGWRMFDKSIYLPDFLKHLFRCTNLRKQIGKTASGVTRFNVSKAKMAKVTIPLPPLSEQERIVSILDRFDKLCHDIREGLPAEIELCQKQYEHYRDKLLTFTDIIGYKNLL